jgi:hypothetical protein
MVNFTYGDSSRTGDDKYVLAQFRSDASLAWVSELRAFLVKDELKYKWFAPERHRVMASVRISTILPNRAESVATNESSNTKSCRSQLASCLARAKGGKAQH